MSARTVSSLALLMRRSTAMMGAAVWIARLERHSEAGMFAEAS